MTNDTLRDAIAARADKLGLTAYAISLQLERQPSPETVKRYLSGRASLETRHASRICEVLGLELRPRR